MTSESVVTKVLIVDDEEMTRVLLSHMLERANLWPQEILMAEDGQQALSIAVEERPDLILLDLLLPKLNGYDVCREIRAMSDYDPYIIILTARGHNTDRRQSKELGANSFMTKPFSPSHLIEELNAYLHHS
ncbi:MAG: response regulator [Anaerolineae bacterium]|nr:response regulator [Anaerolineae bacterium]